MGMIFDFWSYLYYDVFKENEFAFFSIGVFTIHLFAYWSWAIFFMIVDTIGRPKWVLKYKIQPGVNQPVDPKVLTKVVKDVFINEIGISMCYFTFVLYPLMKYFGYSCRPEDLPSIWKALRDLLGCVLFAEFYYYHAHRLFHWGPLYRRIHKKHHEWKAPMGVTAMYTHPLEHICVDLPSYTIAPALMGSHLLFVFLWYMNDMQMTVITHSNYHLPFCVSPEWHDYHHYSFHAIFGTEMGFFDWLYGTSAQFKKSKAYVRDRVLWGLAPARELYPDDNESK